MDATGKRPAAYAARPAIRLSAVHFKESRWEQASSWARYARAAVERLGSARPLEAELENVIGSGASIQFGEPGALEHFTRAYTLARDALGAEHPETLAYQGNALLPLVYLGRIREAHAGLLQVRRLQEKYLGRTHPHLVYLLLSLIDANLRLGERAEARAVVAQLREVVEGGYRLGSSPWVWLHHAEGDLALEEGRDAEALEHYEQAWRLRVGAFGDNLEREAEAAVLVSTALVRLGKPAEALRTLEAPCRAFSRTGAAGALLQTQRCLLALADAHEALGRATRALALREQALRTAAGPQGMENFDSARVRLALAQGLNRMGRAQEALAHAEKAEPLLREALGEGAPLPVQALMIRADALLALGRAREALAVLERAEPGAARKRLAPRDAAHLYFSHARALREAGGPRERVRASAEAALDVLARAPHPDGAEQARVRGWLAGR